MKSEKEILEQVQDFVQDDTIFLGGLLRIFKNPETGTFVSGVIDELPQDFGDLVGIFPNKTFEWAIKNYEKAVQSGKQNVKMSIYVDDLKVPFEQREEFFQKFQLPARFSKMIADHHLTSEDFVGQIQDRFVAESLLKSKGEAMLKVEKESGESGTKYLIQQGATSCSLNSEGRLRLADEMLMLLEYVYSKGFKTIVAYWPKSCELPLSHAARIAPQIFNLTGIRILFVYFDPDCNFPATVFRFEQSV